MITHQLVRLRHDSTFSYFLCIFFLSVRVLRAKEVFVNLILSWDAVHVADFDSLGNRHISGHELFPTLKENPESVQLNQFL